MSKAKSRLQREETHSAQPEERVRVHSSTPSVSLGRRYLKQLPTLFISLPFAFGVFYILTRVSPTQISNYVVPMTYLPLLLTFFPGSFFFFAFIFLHSRRGLLMSLLLTGYLFLRVQQVIFTWQILVFPLVFAVALELLLTFFSRLRSA